MERGTKVAVELLGKGMTQSEVAAVLGVSDSAISQVASNYREQIDELRDDANLGKAGSSALLDKMERTILEKLELAVPMENDVMKLAKMFQVINGAVRRDKGEVGGAAQTKTVVNLNLPHFMQKNVAYQLNAEKQVVEVNGRNLVTANQEKVRELAERQPKETINDLFGQATPKELQRAGLAQDSEADSEES